MLSYDGKLNNLRDAGMKGQLLDTSTKGSLPLTCMLQQEKLRRYEVKVKHSSIIESEQGFRTEYHLKMVWLNYSSSLHIGLQWDVRGWTDTQ